MQDQPLVSVIIPVYNGKKYIDSCIQHLLGQSYGNLEVVVVDDGSTDGTGAIAENLGVKVFYQQNKGVSAARNLGIANAGGEFIHFMDVDDYVNPTYYQLMVDALLKTNAELACSGMVNQKFKHKTILFKKLEVFTTTRDKLTKTYVGRWGYVWRYLFRADFLKKHNLNFDEGRIVEDLIVSFKAVYLAKKLVVVPNAVYIYVYGKDSQIGTKDKLKARKRHKDWLYAKAQMLAFAKQEGFEIPGVNTGRLRYWWWKFFMRKTV